MLQGYSWIIVCGMVGLQRQRASRRRAYVLMKETSLQQAWAWDRFLKPYSVHSSFVFFSIFSIHRTVCVMWRNRYYVCVRHMELPPEDASRLAPPDGSAQGPQYPYCGFNLGVIALIYWLCTTFTKKEWSVHAIFEGEPETNQKRLGYRSVTNCPR